MHWSERGAHLLLQVRAQVLNDELRRTFLRWYSGMKPDELPDHADRRLNSATDANAGLLAPSSPRSL